jgi:hypothetical protein
MRYMLLAFFLLTGLSVNSQTILTIEGQTYMNTEDTWYGVIIPRSAQATFTFRNNSITSINRYGYLIEAGDEVPNANNNNLDGAVITGNTLTWNGTPAIGIIPHGIFTGYNINVKVKYNYLNKVPMAIVRKSNGMTDVSGVVAYNIIKDPGIGVVVKGMNGVRIYNNTFYNSLTTEQTNRALIDIYENPSVTPPGSATGTKIYNNIFYTKNAIKNISVSTDGLAGFECDYNIYYCEAGTPIFSVSGVQKTFAQWQALGYDIHSVVINPNFKDFINFVPAVRLDYGKDLGSELKDGLSVNAKWGASNPETTVQNGKWQAGAVIYAAPAINNPPIIRISSPTKSSAFLSPATITIDATASDPDGTIIKVEFYNGTVKLGEKTIAPYSFTWKEVSEGTYTFTAIATDNSNSKTVSDPVTAVVEKVAPSVNQFPVVMISSPQNESAFEVPAKIILTAEAFDADGVVTKVEYFNGNTKVGESFSAPFEVSLECTKAGSFYIKAVVTDNLNAESVSAAVKISVTLKSKYLDIINLYPNPNFGRFSIEISSPLPDADNTVTITNLLGHTVYYGAIEEEERTIQFDLSHTPTGKYVLIITSGDEIVATKKFIKN